MARNPKYIKMIQSYKWRCLRQKKIVNNPLCERCEDECRSTLASEVHHVKPVETGLTYHEMHQLMFAYSNLMSVCKPCHVALHKALNSFSRDTMKENQARDSKRFIDKFFKE